MSAGVRVLALDDVPPVPIGGDVPAWTPLRLLLGVQAFGVNAQTALRAGEHCIEPHDEADSGHQELYVVLRGRAAVTAAGEQHELGPGGMVFLADPAAHREAVALEAGTTVLAVGAPAGVPYAPMPWEARWAREHGVVPAAPDAGGS